MKQVIYINELADSLGVDISCVEVECPNCGTSLGEYDGNEAPWIDEHCPSGCGCLVDII